jgi:predicted ABC-type ATPase
MVAGPNGAGKTTLVNRLRERGINFGEYINPDDIAQELEGSYDKRVAQAQIIADGRRNACIEEKRSFSFETVMSHPSKVDILVRAKEAGFFVQVFFVGTDDPQTNIERVALRAAQGGHDVPKDKIVARWERTMEQLSEAIMSADQAFVFDNSVSGPVVFGPRLVLQRISFSEESTMPQIQLFAPLPNWVRHYVLDYLEIEFSEVTEGGLDPAWTESESPGQGVSLLELTEDKCRWPIGDPVTSEFFFCGGKPVEGLPYCAYHVGFAYGHFWRRPKD